jgi:hypothetical protein
VAISIFSLLESTILSRALYVAADLNIAELLAQKPLALDALATATVCNKDALKRLMYLLELHEVFVKHQDGTYGLTEFSETMQADHHASIKPFVLHDDPTRFNSYGHLGYSIKTGKASFDNLYGVDYFNYLEKDKVLSTRFDQAMVTISTQENKLIAQKLPWQGVVADVGGGVGHLINEIAAHDTIKACILFDLPETIERAGNLHEKCQASAGSFFEPITFSADTFILKRILHDWDDEKSVLILKNIAQAMRADSKLYIIDGVLDCIQDKKLLATIDLALLTIFSGKERTQQEFTTLLDQAGLEIVHIHTVNSLICALECRKIR